VTNVSLVTTNGANVYSNGNLLVYTNSVSLNANDQFTYVITDGNGGSATGRVNITVTTGSNGQGTGSLSVSGGQVSLTFHGIPGGSYVIERSTNSGVACAVPIGRGSCHAISPDFGSSPIKKQGPVWWSQGKRIESPITSGLKPYPHAILGLPKRFM